MFTHDPSSGLLTLMQTVADLAPEQISPMGFPLDTLNGAKGMVLADAGNALLVAAHSSSAVVEFTRDNATGTLQFSDSVRDGERRLLDLERAMRPAAFDPASAAPPSWMYAHGARGGVHFAFNGSNFLVVAAGAAGARVLEWCADKEAWEEAFELAWLDPHGNVVRDAAALSVSHASWQSASGEEEQFIVVTNAPDAADGLPAAGLPAATACSVYRWSNNRFVYLQHLEVAGRGDSVLVGRAAVWSGGGALLVAVPVTRVNASFEAHSAVLAWDPEEEVLSLSLSLSLTHTQIHTHTFTHTRIHTRTRTHR